jgi:rSAM/selenodomain-associated transferase 1
MGVLTPPAAQPSERCLVVFTKPATPGRVKTRLIGHLSAASAARLHQALLADTLDALAGGCFELRLAFALDPEQAIPPAPTPQIATVSRQRGGDLGERLWNALADAARDRRQVAVVGSDLPGLDARRVEDAFAALADADLAIGPTADGGYYLLAARAARLQRRLFSDIEWSSPRVLAQTLDRCRELGLRVATLQEGRDVDLPEDLRWLAGELDAGRLSSPRVARWMRSQLAAEAPERRSA